MLSDSLGAAVGGSVEIVGTLADRGMNALYSLSGGEPKAAK